MPGGKRLPKEICEAAVSAYDAGYTFVEVGEMLGIHQASAKAIIIRAGVSSRGRLTVVPKEIREAAVSAYVAGFTSLEVADMLGCSAPSVLTWVRAAGEAVRDNVTRKALSLDNRAEIWAEWEAGMSPKEIAVGRELHPTTIQTALRSAGAGDKLRHSCRVEFPYGEPRGDTQGYMYRMVHPDYWLSDSMAVRQRGARSRRLLEHRRVMAEAIGRPLLSTETVHHLNGNRADNRLENLELHEGNHGSRQRWVCANCGCSDRKAVALNG